MTRVQAEAQLRKLIAEVRPTPVELRLTIAELGDRYIDHVEHVRGRKPTTVQDYRCILNAHLGPYFGLTRVDRVTARHVVAYARAKTGGGLARKTIQNHLALLHGIFEHAVRQEIVATNPVARADGPRGSVPDRDIRYLTRGELEALVVSTGEGTFAAVDKALFLTAAMTGLRQGELVALRWGDVDWHARVLRVRRSYSRGQWGTPKSRRGSRAVPLSSCVAAELRQHNDRSPFDSDQDLVFCHPAKGTVLDAAALRRRFKAARDAAGVRQVRFHDLRHTYGTLMAGAGTPLRMLQEWMGHQDYKTTLIYADYAPDPVRGAQFVERAFGRPTGASWGLICGTYEAADHVPAGRGRAMPRRLAPLRRRTQEPRLAR